MARYVLEERAFRDNLSVLARVAERAGVEVILALKAFSFWPTFDIVREYLPGATASSLNEALLVQRHMGVAPHVYCPVYVPGEFDELLALSSLLSFNSLTEYDRYVDRVPVEQTHKLGLRVNPLFSDVATELYNPSAPTGRLGVPIDELPDRLPERVRGVHIHTLCESGAAATAELIRRTDEGLGARLANLDWINFGGGHLVTRAGYEVDVLVKALSAFRDRHPHLHVILEPGSAHVWGAGYLETTILDVVLNRGVATAMLDCSFTCHMPDVLEMPYAPTVRGASYSSGPTAAKHAYRLGGMSCLAGDAIGYYAFEQALSVGDKLVFEDMLHYTVVKSTTFNGVPHPDLAIERPGGEVETLRRFTFADYEARLG